MTELATFAGGCFWCTEAVFQRVKGVIQVTSGYSGGKRPNPTYDQVVTGATGHAEAIQIEFDPNIISYKQLLEIFWAVHDPTTLNKQDYDIGTQYRSAIFYHNQKQRELAEKTKPKNAVTEISEYKEFYPAESYHQNFYNTYKDYNPYCSIIIEPKIQKLIDKFNDLVYYPS